MECDRIYSHTTALCPACDGLVPSRIVERGGRILLEKLCPRDGVSSALISPDPEWYRASRRYVKPGRAPLSTGETSFRGCPDSCGLCPEHRQHTCLPVIEITGVCDLSCPICLKNRDQCPSMTPEEFRGAIEALKIREGEIAVLNLSGGEPTLHPEFGEILTACAEGGVMQTTVSTNGLRLARDGKLRALFKESGAIAALQFDGFSPHTWRVLRGEDLSEMKLDLIGTLEREGVRYSLTATVVGGVNDGEIGAITDFFFRSGALSLMFQPAAFTGAAERFEKRGERLTLSDLVRAIEKSSNVAPGDFNPLPCSHYSCFALSYYLTLGDGRFMSLKDFLGREDYLNVIANRTLPGLDAEGHDRIRERIYEFWSAADSSGDNERVLKRMREILLELSAAPFSPKRAFELGSRSMKGVFIHPFMDKETFDLGRLMKCCNHYLRADGRLVPMCARNIFFQ